MNIKLPPLPEGADSWKVYATTPRCETPKDKRNFFQRIIYKFLVNLHDKAEKFWHWSYYASRKYAPPQSVITGHDYFEINQTENEISDKEQVSD